MLEKSFDPAALFLVRLIDLCLELEDMARKVQVIYNMLELSIL